jgi:hypothetical protein
VTSSGIATEAATPKRAEPSIEIASVESAIDELLRQYRVALQYAADMPILGRSTVKQGWPRSRWGSRLYTSAYVETHVRKQLQALRARLRLELMGAGETEAKKIAALEDKLGHHVEPLFRWRRLVGLLVRLPPVAAALPVVSAASVWPLGEDISRSAFFSAVAVLVATALALWLLVVWPSIRLGFRVKRVIFSGGSDIGHPLVNPDSDVEWEGFPALKPRTGEGPRSFPRINVYGAEDDAYLALRRRKPAEVPIDMLLGLTPYVLTAYSVFFFYGLIDTIAEGELREAVSDAWFGLLLAAAFALVPLALPWYAKKSYDKRGH